MADEPFIARGFHRRSQPTPEALRIPPGQFETRDFPVLSAGPRPRTPGLIHLDLAGALKVTIPESA